ncbi:alpha/beta fold hydrolase [Specibacter cremeus]|uniref:alpha/beta fold hydrolase n=1 Tax=Specibacter cremeus TaxID=1629051 RepID=UPI00197CAAC4|nr:alpha/beta fold hydrolase [Specibacter cremeus]
MTQYAPLAAVHTLSAGTAAARPVVLIHGFASSGAEDFTATGWAADLAAAGHHVTVVDLPGHGDGPAVANPAEAQTARVVAQLAAVVDRVLADTGAATADVIGYSLGARLAWELPAAAPGRVGRLVLGGISPMEPFAMVDTDELRAVVVGASEPTNPLVGMMAQMVGASGRDTGSLINLIGGLAAEPFAPAGNAPAVPTLFVAGADDMMTGGIEELAALVPVASLTRVPGDHRGALDSPELRKAAIDFLA